MRPSGGRADGAAASATGQRGACCATTGGGQRGVQWSARSSRVRRASARASAAPSTRCTSRTARWSERESCCFSIDPRPFEAEAARAQSQLASAKARYALAQSELARAQKLLESRAVSRQEVDQLSSGQRTTQADIQGAEAALRIARLNIEYAQVLAPIAGRVSRAGVTAGNVVNEQSVLTSIVGVSRIYAYFDGSERTFLRLKEAKAGGKAPKVRMALLDEQGFPHEGELDFIDNRLNPQTGAIRMRVGFNNAAGLFTPGLSARLRMEGATAYDAVLVPDRAIGTDQTRKFVYVVSADGKPQQTEVRLGALVDGMRVVQGSVKSGDHVVVDGLQRIQPGMSVSPQLLSIDPKGMPIFPSPGTAGRRRPSRSQAPGPDPPDDQAMDISRFFIDRPRFAAVLSILVFLLGCWPCSSCRSPNIRRSHRRRSWCGRSSLARTPASSPRRWLRRWKSRSTASRTCSTSSRRRRLTAA
jgi:multidrug efflux system membrane fusion protein